MQIFDTLGNKKRKLEFSDKVRIYLCGVTVYDEAHIGHARTIIVFDVLRRFLESQKIPVEFIQNFTDVDNKILDRAKELRGEGEHPTAEELAEKYCEEYVHDFDGLNVQKATEYPKASKHIPDMQNLISDLIAKGHAYIKKDGVYFSVRSLSGRMKKSGKRLTRYGKLKGVKNTDELVSVAMRTKKKRLAELIIKYKGKPMTGSDDLELKADQAELDELNKQTKLEGERKKDILDFALWKVGKYDRSWHSPWGDGRPGWHIECSAMSLKYLGENFEIHGGGRDLIFPHHENEIAQSESSTLKHYAKIWMHVGMVTIDNVKMSKSEGNVKTVKHVFENWGSNIIRLFCLSGKYTKPIDYTEKLLRENITKLRQIESCYYELRLAEGTSDSAIADKLVKESREKFDSALNDDLNTPLALSAFYKLIRDVIALAAKEKITQTYAEIILPEFKRISDILGIQIIKVTDEEKNEINQMVKKRDEYRMQKNYADADNIRAKIAEKNIIFVDHKNKTTWVKQEKIKAE